MDKATKEMRVAELTQVVRSVPSMILASYTGMNVESMTDLRRQLRQGGVAFKVIKNTLLNHAVKGTNLEGLGKFLVGPIGIAYSVEDDPASPARLCLDYARKNDKFQIKGGFVEGEVFGIEGVQALSTLPTKDQARAMFLSTLVSAAQQFLALLEAAPQQLVGVLNARKDQLEKEGDQAAA